VSILDLLNTKRKRADGVTTRIEELKREKATAETTCRARQSEREKLKQQVVDTRAMALLAEDRQVHDAELQRLGARLPEIDREVHDLEEALPSIGRHLAELEQSARLEQVEQARGTVLQAANGRDELLRRWNSAAEELLSAAGAIGFFNGRMEIRARAYQDATQAAKVKAENFDHIAINSEIARAMRERMNATWQTGYHAGQAEG